MDNKKQTNDGSRGNQSQARQAGQAGQAAPFQVFQKYSGSGQNQNNGAPKGN